MNGLAEPSSRRTVSQHGLLARAGARNLNAWDSASFPDIEPLPPEAGAFPTSSKRTMVLYVSRLETTDLLLSSDANAVGGRFQKRAEILDHPQGERIGEFRSSCLMPCSTRPAGWLNPPAVELQTVRVRDGVLYGISANDNPVDNAGRHTILFGTGCFAGTRGSYVIRSGADSSGREADELIIDVME